MGKQKSFQILSQSTFNYDLVSFFQKANEHAINIQKQRNLNILKQQTEAQRQKHISLKNLEYQQKEEDFTIKRQSQNKKISKSQRINNSYSQLQSQDNIAQSHENQLSQEKIVVRKSQRKKKQVNYNYSTSKKKQTKPKKSTSIQQTIKSSFFDQIKKAQTSLIKNMKVRFQNNDESLRRGLYYKIVCEENFICNQCINNGWNKKNQECKKCIQKGGYWINRRQLMKFNNGNCMRQFLESFF